MCRSAEQLYRPQISGIPYSILNSSQGWVKIQLTNHSQSLARVRPAHNMSKALHRNSRAALRFPELDDPVALRWTAKARRLSLRVDPRTGLATAVAPPHIPKDEVHRFVGRNLGWLSERLAAVPEPVPFIDQALVPYIGQDHRVRHVPEQREPVVRTDLEFRVGGEAPHLGRRLLDFLKTAAVHELSTRACEKSERLGIRPSRVTVRDTRSRWGSCSANGRLSFSWRLILAPEPVIDYVVGHEVAHLKEMNHSGRFWRLVAQLTPGFEHGRDWLKAHGSDLHRYGSASGDRGQMGSEPALGHKSAAPAKTRSCGD